MVDNSLLLIAVKRCMSNSYGNTGNTFQSLMGESSLDISDVEVGDMKEYINYMIEEISPKNLPAELHDYRRNLVNALNAVSLFETYEYRDESQLLCNTYYANNVGKISMYANLFTEAKNNIVRVETLYVSANFRLADIAVTITKSKRSWFGSSTWTETRYIKPAVKFGDYVTALGILISPILQSSIEVPAGLPNLLKKSANSVPDTMPSDDARRTVYDPMNKMNVVVTDEEVLKLIPGRWEYVTSEMVHAEQANSGKYWEFDE